MAFFTLILLINLQTVDEDDNMNNSTSKEDAGKTLAATLGSIEVTEDSPLLGKNIPRIQTAGSSDAEASEEENTSIPIKYVKQTGLSEEFFTLFRRKLMSRREDKRQPPRSLHSPGSASVKSFDLQVGNWRIETLGRDSESGSDEEFFDCEGEFDDVIFPSNFYYFLLPDSSSLAKWSSLELLSEEDLDTGSPTYIENNKSGIRYLVFFGYIES